MKKKDMNAMTLKNNIKCWFADHNIAIDTHGYVTPCCIYNWGETAPDAKDHTAIELYDIPEIQTIRNNLKNGIRDEGCNRCWNDEEAGALSVRQRRNMTGFAFNKKNKIEEPDFTNLELAFSNVCNLICRHCSTQSSSRWAKDDRLLQRPVPTKILKEIDIDNLRVHEIESLKRIRMYGGEPFYSKAHDRLINELHSRDKMKNLMVEYITNATIFPKENIINAWKELKHLRIFISIEDYGEEFEYFRTGANFQKFKENVNKFLDLRSENVEIGFHFTLNVLNAHRADDVLAYYLENFPNCDMIHYDRVHEPEYLRAEQWDAQTLIDAETRLRSVISSHCKNIQHLYSLSAVADALRASAINNEADFTELFKVNDILDRSRNTSLDAVHPIFSKYRNR